jgi:hypothetical protein
VGGLNDWIKSTQFVVSRSYLGLSKPGTMLWLSGCRSSFLYSSNSSNWSSMYFMTLLEAFL